jgi:hypothetical protein
MPALVAGIHIFAPTVILRHPPKAASKDERRLTRGDARPLPKFGQRRRLRGGSPLYSAGN